MKRRTTAVYATIATLALFSCEKIAKPQDHKTSDNLKTKIYVLNGEEYPVTYSENARTGECVLEKGSTINQTIGEFIASHEQAVIVDHGASGKCFLYADIAAFQESRSFFFGKHHEISAQEKTSNNLVRATFYEHANYVNVYSALTATTSTLASNVTDPALSSRIQTFVGANWASSKVFWNSWVGASYNDRISSIYAEKVSGTIKLQPWNHFVIAIYEDLNYGGDVYFFVRTDAEIPTGNPNLQNVSMWGGFNNFNDETSSFWGSAFVY